MKTTARTPKTASRKRLLVLIRREGRIKDIMRIQEYPKGGNGELGEGGERENGTYGKIESNEWR